MYQEVKRKQESEELERDEIREENFYTFNLNSTRIYFILISFLFIISFIFLFGYWIGKIKGEMNKKIIQASIDNERKMVSKLLPPETSQINLKEDFSHENSIPKKRYSKEEKSEKFDKDFSRQNSSLDKVKKITTEAVLKSSQGAIYKHRSANEKNNFKISSSKKKSSMSSKKSRFKKFNRKKTISQEQFKKGYHVKVSANKNQKYALDFKNKLIAKGYHAYITKRNRNNRMLYILSIGPFSNMKDAKDTKDFLLKDFLNLKSAYVFKY